MQNVLTRLSETNPASPHPILAPALARFDFQHILNPIPVPAQQVQQVHVRAYRQQEKLVVILGEPAGLRIRNTWAVDRIEKICRDILATFFRHPSEVRKDNLIFIHHIPERDRLGLCRRRLNASAVPEAFYRVTFGIWRPFDRMRPRHHGVGFALGKFLVPTWTETSAEAVERLIGGRLQ